MSEGTSLLMGERHRRYNLMAEDARRVIALAMVEGESTHTDPDGWRGLRINEHLARALIHLSDWGAGDRAEDHLGHVLARIAMIRELEREGARPDPGEDPGRRNATDTARPSSSAGGGVS